MPSRTIHSTATMTTPAMPSATEIRNDIFITDHGSTRETVSLTRRGPRMAGRGRAAGDRPRRRARRCVGRRSAPRRRRPVGASARRSGGGPTRSVGLPCSLATSALPSSVRPTLRHRPGSAVARHRRPRRPSTGAPSRRCHAVVDRSARGLHVGRDAAEPSLTGGQRRRRRRAPRPRPRRPSLGVAGHGDDRVALSGVANCTPGVPARSRAPRRPASARSCPSP